ncbi:MAG: hypothetical protein JOZ02_22305 [Acidobacteria bacterium]|nr:hypothetical protein [Acidobacteriota bacterium]
MEANPAVPKRGALYYPYIHITNENWLKSTLLCFGNVKRIVPDLFTTRDYETIKPYASLRDRNDEPLLGEAKIYTPAVHDAQKALKDKIEAHLDVIERRFGLDNTPAEYRSGKKSFQINSRKLLENHDDPGLGEFLMLHKLAWHTDDKWDRDWDQKSWLTMHPRLGAAVMSTLALAVEEDQGLNIVTPSVRAHNALLANREDQVFQALLELPTARAEGDLGETVDELVEIVITTGFDLTRLGPEDIQGLIKDDSDLQQFRREVAALAQEIPPGMGPEARDRALRQKADAILETWRERQRLLPPSVREAITEGAVEKIAEKVGEQIRAGLAGAAGGAAAAVATHSVLALAPGVAVSVLVMAGVKFYFGRKHGGPRYLNRIRKVTDASFGSLYVPQWRVLAGKW